MTVITRFAPSPTGSLHIGGVRTALFNWLYAKANNGKFLLRIEDTDKVRSTQDAINSIIKDLSWLGLNHDDSIVFQSSNIDRHKAVAFDLLKKEKAYKCYATADDLAEMRKLAEKEKKTPKYDGRWRDRTDHPINTPYVIRLKVPQNGRTILNDMVQGEVIVSNSELDDMVLLRSDGTPTYMLSVVVDDYDMGITDIIRGDDHLTNTFRQIQIFNAMEWNLPNFAHIPLIHGQDGKKLSKRHGAVGIKEFQSLGFDADTLLVYLSKLGWNSSKFEWLNDRDDNWKHYTKVFDIKDVNRSPSRLDLKKLNSVSFERIKLYDNTYLAEQLSEYYSLYKGIDIGLLTFNRFVKGMDGLKIRSHNFSEMADLAIFYVDEINLIHNDTAMKLISTNINHLKSIYDIFKDYNDDWNQDNLNRLMHNYCEDNVLKISTIGQTLRAALTGTTISPGICEIMVVLGKNETLNRFKKLIG